MANVISYLHPHIVTSVIDNSQVITSTISPDNTCLFMPYVSDRGVDGVIEKYTSYAQFIADKGTPNFKKHGEPIYDVLQFLSGGGTVYGIRVMPEDAEYAKAVLSTKELEYEATIDTENPDGSITDEDGNVITTGTLKSYELATFKCKGRGEYGNRFKVEVRLNKTLTIHHGTTMYDVLVYENGQVIEGPFYCALDPYAVNNSGTSIFMGNVINNYSNSITCEFNEANYDEIIMELGAEGSQIDILTDGQPVAVSLEGGLDGQFEQPLNDEEPAEGSLEAAYIKAFSDKQLASKRFYPIDILMDAGFGKGVRRAIQNLAIVRGDCMAFCGVADASPNEAVAGPEQFSTDIQSRSVAFYCQKFVVYDAFTRADMKVSMNYFLAYKIPANDNTYGMHMPLAGLARGVITGFKSMNYNPTTPEEKEVLYRNRINYAEQDYRNTKLMSQLTSQEMTSALSNINNMRVLLRMIRDVEQISENYYFEFANTTTLNAFQGAVNNYLQQWISNGACTTAVGSVFQNDYDVEQKIVRVQINLVFTGIIERISITFNVGN